MKKNTALQQGLIPGSLTHTCQRCGQSETLYSVSRFTEADYIELFHELLRAQRDLRQWKALHAAAVQRLNERRPGQI